MSSGFTNIKKAVRPRAKKKIEPPSSTWDIIENSKWSVSNHWILPSDRSASRPCFSCCGPMHGAQRVNPKSKFDLALSVQQNLSVAGCTLVALTVVQLFVSLAQIRDTASAAATNLAPVAAIGVVLLSSASHYRSLKTSSLLLLYLLAAGCSNLSTVSKLATTRSLMFLDCFVPVLGTIQLILLVLECTSKTDWLLPKYRDLAPVETANVFSAVSFWWMNKLLAQGNKRIFKNEDLPPLDSKLKAANLNEITTKPETKWTLCKMLFKTHKRQFIVTLIPRLFMVLFECSQPLLIKTVIRYVDSPQRNSSCYERYLVLAAATVYIGSTLSGSQYLYRTARLELSVKSSLKSLVYQKTLETVSHAADTGKATTVMSTDVDAIADSPAMFHDLVGRVLEVTFGLLILGDQVKWIWPVPIVIIFFCSRVSKYVAKNIRPRQRNWNEATERRIGALGAILGAMKSVKALGIKEALLSYVADLRRDELLRAGEKRLMDCQYNASANALGVFAPALTVALFATVSHVRDIPLDSAVLFTMVAALSIVTHPANMIMTIYPRVISVAASFERFQQFLLASPLEDTRTVDDENPPVDNRGGTAVSLTDVTVDGKPGQPILSNINMKLSFGSVTVCCGTVGSGKSVLGKTILGEVPKSKGRVEVTSKRIGFCDQLPWLMAGTVKEVICAFASSIDETKYRAVIKACCLNHDLNQFHERDGLYIGSRGVNLSGGQKQRIALARMLYAGEAIVVLDDSFAALDGGTEIQVIENLLGPSGLLRERGAAVLWITNSAQYFHLADHVVLLEDGKISQQGTAESVRPYVNELRKFNVQHDPPPHEAPTRLAKKQAEKDAENDLYRQTGDFSLYRYYIQSTGLMAPIAVVGTISLYAMFNTIPTYWIKYWADKDRSNTAIFAIGYVFFAFMAWIGTSIHMWTTTFLLAKRSGTYLHNALAAKIFGAPLSYFVATDIGVTLNRFSHDIDLVDRQLPSSFSRLASQCTKMIAQIVVMSLVQSRFAYVVPACAVVVYFVQKVYLRTSRQLRVLDLEATASLYSNFHETIDGLPTIRAFGWQRAAEQRNINAIDLSMRPEFLLRCLNRWLLIVLELIVNTIAIGMVALAVMGSTGQGTSIGVALNLVIVTNTTLISLVLSFTNLEVSLGAISRLKQVDESTPQEDLPQETNMPQERWPARGELTLKDLATGYSFNRNVLSQVNLVANAGQKLVICGRTGSGKSTIFMSLLRLIESTGAIKVDGLNILDVPRSVVRSRCFIAVPQDGIVFPNASLRFNLDPTTTVGDETLTAALITTDLWGGFSSVNDAAEDILDQKLSKLPPLSSGQRQLFALARAIAQKHRASSPQPYSDSEGGPQHRAKPIVLLDELTAFMDSATESKVYDIVEKEFVSENHTVVIVSHRLGGLLGRLREGVDEVAVIRDGHMTVETNFRKLAGAEGNDENSEFAA
ncbi:hypothetical protein NLG97_g2757 [Lecanicillium saksenae]|uniref:Uncharacterized protein n=1 Tax=Lecanicillium saksenae TaxID=468837 RepID=A0ACC1R006_9HYPO|nr:hypothetical protein NLG97_g2757 [Lecanicillium saksenae]